MKKYNEYMDGIKAPDTLHQRLVELESSGKRPIPWKRYGTMAAALALVCGLGGLAAWAAHINSQTGPIPLYPSGYQGTNPEIADEPVPDIALVEPGDVEVEVGKTLGGYEVASGSGESAMTAYYILPYIEYGGTNGTETASQVALDWDIPAGASRRDLSREEIITLLGGEDAVNTHLDWGGYELTGWAARYEDGSFWGAYIYGYEGPLDHFEFAVTAGQMPPTCIVFPDSVTQEIRGLTVTADGHDGKNGCARRVSFMKDDYGYRFDLTSTDVDQAELLVSRLVCRIADKGLALDALFSDGAVLAHPWEADPNYGVGDADGSYTCADCGVTVLAGEKHYHTQDETHTCPICGEVLPIDVEHSHLAPDPAESWEISDGHPLVPEGWTGRSGGPG